MNALLLQGVDATCSMLVSPGDQSVGISAYNDASCKTGGIGCFQGGACCYCKTRDTVQSQNFLVCEEVADGTLDVGTPPAPAPITPAPTTAKPPPATTAPLAQIPTGTCAPAVSSGDQAVGIAGVADANCKNGGLGCFYDGACRYCKTRETPQASSYLPCSNFVTTTTTAPTPIPTTMTATSVATTAPPVTPSPPVTIAPPPATTAPSVQIPAGTCASGVSSGDQAVGIAGVADASCKNGGLGCFYDGACRYCKTRETPQASSYLPCYNFVTATPTASAPTTPTPTTPTPTTPAPTTVTPVTPAPTPEEPVGGTSSIDNTGISTLVCPVQASRGDQTNGIYVITDESCSYNPTVGCFKDICRYCKTKDTGASNHLMPCLTGAVTPAPTTSTTTTATAPATPGSAAPLTPTTTAPAYAGKLCNVVVSLGDLLLGIKTITDPKCEWESGVGCFQGVCRFCKTKVTAQSQHFIDCPADVIPSSAAAPTPVTATAPAPAPAPTSVVPVPTPAPVPAGQLIAQACKRSVSLGDSLQGIAVVTDNTCFIQGGVGCVDDYCRFCKAQNTLASQHLLPCSDFPTVPATVKTPASNLCSATVPNSQALSGIWANVECLEWYKGSCLKSKCPLCKFYDTAASADLPACVAPPTAPIVPAALPGAPPPNLCTEAILGEAQPSVGIWATWDQTCSSSDSACVSKCRFCKYVDTMVSSPLRWCASIAPLPPTPVFVPPPAGTARPPTPAPNDCSARDVTAEKEAAGIWANAQCYEADPSGFCISVVCSPCSFYATEQSFKYPACVNGIFPYWSSTSTSPLVLVRGAAPSELSASDGAGAGAGAGEHLSTFEIAVAVAAAVGIVTVFAMVIYGVKRLVERATTGDAPSILCDSSIENGEGRPQQMLPQGTTSRRKVKAPRTPVMA